MKYLKNILIIFLAFFLVLFDVALFSNFVFFGATFLSSFVVMLVFCLVSTPRKYYIYLISLILFFTGFSSLPIVLIYINFLVLPLLLSYLKSNFFSEPTITLSAVYFLFSTMIFELSLLIYSRSWNIDGYKAVLAFVVVNTLLGVTIYGLVQRMRHDFVSAKIKL